VSAASPPSLYACMLSLGCPTAACRPSRGCRQRCLSLTGGGVGSPPAADASPKHVAPHENASTTGPAFVVPQSPPEPVLFSSLGAAVNVVPFSAAPGGGLPLWAPSGLALTLLAVLAARESRPRRGLAVEALTAFTVQPDSSPPTSPVMDAETFAALQRAEVERRAREAAEEAVREAERRRFVEAEQLRLEARSTTLDVDRSANLTHAPGCATGGASAGGAGPSRAAAPPSSGACCPGGDRGGATAGGTTEGDCSLILSRFAAIA
jgi:hypothetical protein